MSPVNTEPEFVVSDIDYKLASANVVSTKIHDCFTRFHSAGSALAQGQVPEMRFKVYGAGEGPEPQPAPDTWKVVDTLRPATYFIPRFGLLDYGVDVRALVYDKMFLTKNDGNFMVQATVPRVPWLEGAVRLGTDRTLINGEFHAVTTWEDALAAGLEPEDRWVVQSNGRAYWVHDLVSDLSFTVNRRELLEGVYVRDLIRGTEYSDGNAKLAALVEPEEETREPDAFGGREWHLLHVPGHRQAAAWWPVRDSNYWANPERPVPWWPVVREHAKLLVHPQWLAEFARLGTNWASAFVEGRRNAQPDFYYPPRPKGTDSGVYERLDDDVYRHGLLMQPPYADSVGNWKDIPAVALAMVFPRGGVDLEFIGVYEDWASIGDCDSEPEDTGDRTAADAESADGWTLPSCAVSVIEGGAEEV
ncbi:hypothetical protein AURDEDRAFT_177023 [Auricularia subglabra TFB-10046 SS5]|uniref:Uncharacterized protein n=1 Tax=Auricularia subglabra (strain TFB-10046 / SS5) TaxID=717982 RepID=J0D573_AURST|nr:hypothetical protein AURDEDRAFT_177023 [Auricularia subglabra TFB-10046 SS5]